jgi:N-acetylglucosaminyl-diphospho-decaprenol L-rhamnosyltransferase
MAQKTIVSVIITTWNSAAHLPRCLEKISSQILKDFEGIVVDNSSSDGTLDGLESRWPGLDIRVLRPGENQGFAAANNLGARMACGQWLAIINPDAFPAPDWLE